jgi:nucleoporin SEH1
VATNIGVATTSKEFYLAVEINVHRGLVRDVAWAPGNIRGYDIIATACQDGYARVFRLETPYSDKDGKSWSAASLFKAERSLTHRESIATKDGSTEKQQQQQQQQHHHSSSQSSQHHQHPSTLSASLAKSGANGDRPRGHHADQVKHVYREISKLDSHRTPIWRVGFDDDGQILGTTGDDGKLLCYRQTPDGSWIKSSELAMMKTRMAAP